MKQAAWTERSLAPGFTRAQVLANAERVFEEAFGSSSGSPVEDAMVDRVEYAPEGLRISYGRPTAEWLTSVTERPHDFGLVYDFLVEEILGCSSHPLGRVADEFVSLMSLFSPDSSSGGWDDGAETEASASPNAADARTPLAAQVMKIGVARLHGLVSAVLPQLQHNPGRGFALAAVEAVLFDRCSAVLSALLGGASGEDGSRCEFLELEALLPRHLGVRQPFWLEAEEAETPRGRTPRGRTPRSRRSAAASGTAEQEGQGRLGQDVDAQLPYAHAIALVQGMPRVAAPRQKLQLFCDACTEAQRCVARHHEAAGARRREARPQHAHAAPAAAAEAEAGAVGGAPAAAASPEAMALGAEDLIPVMAYVLLRARLCHLDTQLRLIEVFVDGPSWQAALLGPLGYGLATLHAATQLLLSFCRTARGDATPATPATPAAPLAASPRAATAHRARYHRIGAPLAPASPANGAAHSGSPGCDKRSSPSRSSPSLRERARLVKRSLCGGGGTAAASIVGALVTEPAHLGALRGHLGASRGCKGAADARPPAGRGEAAVPVHSRRGDDGDASGQGPSAGVRSAAQFGGAAAVAARRARRHSAARKLGPEERPSPRSLASPAPCTPVPRIWSRARASAGGGPTLSDGNAVTAAAPATGVAASPAATQPLPTAGPGPDLPDAPATPAPATPNGARPRVGVPDGTRAAYRLSLPVAVVLPAAEETPPPASERGSLTRRGGGRRRQYYDHPEMGCVTFRDAGDAETENQSPSTMASMVGARLPPPQLPATAAETAASAGERPTSAGAEGDGPRHTPCKPRRKQYIQTPNAEDQARTSPTAVGVALALG